jgi:starch synthase
MSSPLKVLLVTSECVPFAKTGGLGDVVGALARVLHRQGIDARIVMPLYAGMPWREFEILEGILTVPTWFGTARAGVRLGRLPRSQVPVYFLEYHQYFDRPYLYGPPGGDYPDNFERFAFLSRGALELCTALGWIPDVVHANDWQTALVPVYVNTVEWGRPLHGSASVYTIHNLAYQGIFERDDLPITGLGHEHFHSGEFEHFGTLNLTKAAFAHSTVLSTVSPTYAREIQTSAYGFGLDGVLRSRGFDLFGILNGIDVEEWNPATDPWIAAHFDASDLSGKRACTAALQHEAGLPARHEVPVFGVIGRAVSQKGFDVLAQALDQILEWDLQIVVLASGDSAIEAHFAQLAGEHDDRMAVWLAFDDARAHRIEAGADFFIMPSRFEPCGLSQMYSLRYGTLPIVRATGGLIDTVENYEQASGRGTGFVFNDLDVDSLANTIGWAFSTWHDRPHHIDALRRRGMRRDFSWDRAAREYERMYRLAVARRRGHPST